MEETRPETPSSSSNKKTPISLTLQSIVPFLKSFLAPQKKITADEGNNTKVDAKEDLPRHLIPLKEESEEEFQAKLDEANKKREQQLKSKRKYRRYAPMSPTSAAQSVPTYRIMPPEDDYVHPEFEISKSRPLAPMPEISESVLENIFRDIAGNIAINYGKLKMDDDQTLNAVLNGGGVKDIAARKELVLQSLGTITNKDEVATNQLYNLLVHGLSNQGLIADLQSYLRAVDICLSAKIEDGGSGLFMSVRPKSGKKDISCNIGGIYYRPERNHGNTLFKRLRNGNYCLHGYYTMAYVVASIDQSGEKPVEDSVCNMLYRCEFLAELMETQNIKFIFRYRLNFRWKEKFLSELVERLQEIHPGQSFTTEQAKEYLIKQFTLQEKNTFDFFGVKPKADIKSEASYSAIPAVLPPSSAPSPSLALSDSNIGNKQRFVSSPWFDYSALSSSPVVLAPADASATPSVEGDSATHNSSFQAQ